MSVNIYFNLLFLYGVLCQGIIGTVSEKDIGESAELLVRQKRVISRVPGEDLRESVRDVPYIVFIREKRTENHCPGTILSRVIVITVAKCVILPNEKYQIFSGTSRTEPSRRSAIHDIIVKRSYHGIHPFRTEDGISLIRVGPPFALNSAAATQSIPLFQGDLHPGTLALVSGWGCDETGNFQTQHPHHLRSIIVPIISLDDCINIYHRLFAIGTADICTLDPNQHRYCTVKDVGAPLVVKVNDEPHLAGVHLWNGGVAGRPNPDVFINLQDRWYNPWILENKRNMEENAFIHTHG